MTWQDPEEGEALGEGPQAGALMRCQMGFANRGEQWGEGGSLSSTGASILLQRGTRCSQAYGTLGSFSEMVLGPHPHVTFIKS